MMTKHLSRAAFALLLAAVAAAPAAAQQPRERERAAAEQAAAAERMRQQAAFREDAERRAFDMLLNHRTQLELSAQQVRELEAIRERLEQQNAPLRARLVEEHSRLQAERRAQVERMSAEQRRAELHRLRRDGRPAVPPALQPTVRQMRLNINEAVHQAQGVLTAEQRLRAQALIRRELQRARAHGMQPGARQEQRREEMQRRREGRRQRVQERRP